MSKIKYDEILRWSIELFPYSFGIKYRPGRLNVEADALLRSFYASTSSSNILYLSIYLLLISNIKELNSSLYHPGVNRMLHFVRSRNLFYSNDQIKNVISSCEICSPRKYVLQWCSG